MKQFMQGCAIAAVVLIVLGLGMTSIAGSLKGKETIKNVVESVTDGKVQVNLDSISDWGITVGENLDNVHYEIEDSMVFDSHHDIMNGDVEKYSVGNAVNKLDIQVGGCTFIIKESGDSDYYLEAKNTKKFQGYVENDTLYVKGTIGTAVVASGKECEITLYVPENWADNRLEKVNMELGAGVMQMDGIAADKVLLEVGAGQIEISEITADTLDISVGMGEIIVGEMSVEKLLGEVGMGHLYLEGAIYDKADVECAMGSLEMVVEGTQNDFNYDVECGMGNITIEDKSFSGVAQERDIDNGASKKMLVECAMGDVNISFTE